MKIEFDITCECFWTANALIQKMANEVMNAGYEIKNVGVKL